jgi:ribosomal protein S18 acetylase RimI-like enzyme
VVAGAQRERVDTGHAGGARGAPQRRARRAPVAEQPEEHGIVGAVIAGWDGWRGNMYRLAVDAQHRRRGIARALVGAGERHLRSKGARRITALVAHEELDAVGFWTEAGYARDTTIARFVKQLGD